jgi:hypothetical protein
LNTSRKVFPFPLSLLLASVIAVSAASCAPDPVESSRDLLASLTSATKEPTPDLYGRMTVGSKRIVAALAEAGAYEKLRNRLLVALKDAKAGAEKGVVGGSDPVATVFLVRDGLARDLDLGLSGATFAALRETQYPAPW